MTFVLQERLVSSPKAVCRDMSPETSGWSCKFILYCVRNVKVAHKYLFQAVGHGSLRFAERFWPVWTELGENDCYFISYYQKHYFVIQTTLSYIHLFILCIYKSLISRPIGCPSTKIIRCAGSQYKTEAALKRVPNPWVCLCRRHALRASALRSNFPLISYRFE